MKRPTLGKRRASSENWEHFVERMLDKGIDVFNLEVDTLFPTEQPDKYKKIVGRYGNFFVVAGKTVFGFVLV